MSINTQSRVGELAAEHPLATRVFARHGIDFCCGGGRPLKEACDRLGLDSEAIVAEIKNELETSKEPEHRWDLAPLDDLIHHIVETYHKPLKEELPRLQFMAEKVLKVHGDKDPERLGSLVSVFHDLKSELDEHMVKEERILFPMIESGQGASANGPISVMEHEHDSTAQYLRRLRELTNNYEVPEGACNTWRALWHGLAALEASLHRHIHLENNILFPRSLSS